MAVDRNYFMQQHYLFISLLKKNKSSSIKMENGVLLEK